MASSHSDDTDLYADVLEVRDCCFAGLTAIALEPGSEERRTYEIPAATTNHGTTPKSGPRSYSHALIYAIKECLVLFKVDNIVPIDTFQLNQAIRRKMNWSNLPQLYTASAPSSRVGHICLEPLLGRTPVTCLR
jgi:hypothetical protein